MKHLLLFLACTCMAAIHVFSQKAREVIENGIKVNSDQEIFLRFDGSKIKYQRNSMPGMHFKDVDDSALLLPVEGSLLMYIRPLNPLNYSFKGENKIVVDPIDEAAATALSSISDLLMNVMKQNDAAVAVAKGAKAAGIKLTPAQAQVLQQQTFCPGMSPLVRSYDEIVDKLKQDQKNSIKATFSRLKALSFEAEEETKDGIKDAKDTIDKVSEHYQNLQEKIEKLKTDVKTILCEDKNEEFIAKQVFAGAVKDLEVTYANQRKRLTNLQKAYDLVRKAQQEASRTNWLVPVYEVPAERGKVSIFSVKVNEAGYKLSEQEEIVEAETKEKATKVLRVRRFQRFVPEVSVGVAYTNLSFPKYGTVTNGAGKQVVAQAGEDVINQVNFSTMINYNLFLRNSPLHPFWQIGIGLNADFPTLLSGVGVRINANGVRRLALAFGLATTWIKTLQGLDVGEEVAGPAVVEEHTKRNISKPQTYFGVQFNF